METLEGWRDVFANKVFAADYHASVEIIATMHISFCAQTLSYKCVEMNSLDMILVQFEILYSFEKYDFSAVISILPVAVLKICTFMFSR